MQGTAKEILMLGEEGVQGSSREILMRRGEGVQGLQGSW